MEDRRAVILNQCDWSNKPEVFNAMDQYATEMCLELLEYMAKNFIICEVNIAKEKRFYFKGQWISKEQLFENFL